MADTFESTHEIKELLYFSNNSKVYLCQCKLSDQVMIAKEVNYDCPDKKKGINFNYSYKYNYGTNYNYYNNYNNNYNYNYNHEYHNS